MIVAVIIIIGIIVISGSLSLARIAGRPTPYPPKKEEAPDGRIQDISSEIEEVPANNS